MALRIFVGAANIKNRCKCIERKIYLSKVNLLGRLRDLKVQELSFFSSLDRRISEGTPQHIFYLNNFHIFKGREPFLKLRVLMMLHWVMKDILKKKIRDLSFLMVVLEANNKESMISLMGTTSLVEG
jgi:hypothetical protein